MKPTYYVGCAADDTSRLMITRADNQPVKLADLNNVLEALREWSKPAPEPDALAELLAACDDMPDYERFVFYDKLERIKKAVARVRGGG